MNRKKHLIFILFGLALGAGAAAHEAQHPIRQTVASATSAPEPVPLAARYDLRSNGTQTEWFLWRDANSVETADRATGQNNIWERLNDHDYANIRVFNREKRIVEYTPGELRTRQAEPDWSKLASIVSPQVLTSLKRGSSKELFGQKATRYSGKTNHQSIELWWLENARLPASLKIVGDRQRLSMTLRELHARAPADWPRATEARLAGYARMDAADFGDMEYDPFVARLLQEEGHQHAH